MPSRTLSLEVPLPPAELRGNSNAHYMVRHRARKAMRVDGWFHAAQQYDYWKPRFAQAKVTFEFHNPRTIDLDNLAYGMKAFCDGLFVDSELTKDDSPEYVTYGEHRFVKCKRGQECTLVTIEEVLK